MMKDGRKRTTEKVRKNGLQERLGRVQKVEEENGGEAEEFSEEEKVLETLYKAFQPSWGC